MRSLLSCLLPLLLLRLLPLFAAADGSKSCPDIFGEEGAWQPSPGDRRQRLDPSRLAALAAPLAIPRTVGSAGHRLVRDRLIEALQGLAGDGKWLVEVDSFTAETPLGRRRFDNIIATLAATTATARPEAEAGRRRRHRRVVLAAHYDSKRLSRGSFVGATDSAVPCAMLLLLADTLRQRLAGTSPEVAVQLVFFDGEEAFEQWTKSDSLYGSRHLARRWSAEEGANPGCQSAREIEALVLLDLIGGRDPRFFYSPNPASVERLVAKEMSLFQELVATETAIRLSDDRLLSSRGRRHRYFQWPQLGSGLVQDDHTPFQEAGVPAVHVIPQQFPSVWHTPADTLEAVEWDQAADVATIVFVWLAQKVGPIQSD